MSPVVACALASLLSACARQVDQPPSLHWYVYAERSGAFEQAARRCSDAAQGRYTIEFVALPSDASQQREQLVRRLAAGDTDIDIIGMDVIWTAEFAEAGLLNLAGGCCGNTPEHIAAIAKGVAGKKPREVPVVG